MSFKSLFVDNLHDEVTEAMLKQKFSVVGAVDSVHIHYKGERCFAYINFTYPGHAFQAFQTMNNDLLKGMPMEIKPNKLDPALQKAKNANVYLKNLDKSITNDQLKKECEKFGQILSLKIASDENGSRGYAYVNFTTEKQAQMAIKHLNGKKMGKNRLHVEKYKAPNERPNTSKADSSQKWRNKEVSWQIVESSSEDEDEKIQSQSYLFVEKSPTIIDAKLRYLKSMLCGKYKHYCNKKINKAFDSSNAKGRLASVNGNVLLVTLSETEHIKCCEVLNQMIQCVSLPVPSTEVQVKIDDVSLKRQIKSEKLKYLGLCKMKEFVEVGCFNIEDLEKGKKIVENFLERFQEVSTFLCNEQRAKLLIKKVSSKFACQLSVVPYGLKLVGDKASVNAGLTYLRTKRFFDGEVEFLAPKISSFFTSSEWQKTTETLETTHCCVISLKKEITKKSSSKADVQFYVYQGNIVKERSDAIVNGVSKNFDLKWGAVSRLIVSKAGNDVVDAFSNNPLISLRNLRVTGAGDLPCNYIFHMVTPSSGEELAQTIQVVLKKADQFGMASLSFPTLGAGGVGLDPLDVALAMKKAFDEFLVKNQSKETNLKTVNVVVYEPSLVQVFKQYAVPVGGSHSTGGEEILCDDAEKYAVAFTCLKQTDKDQMMQKLSKLKSCIIKEEEIEEDLSNHEHEKLEIKNLGLKHGVTIKIADSRRMKISGLEENVKCVKKGVNSILRDLHFVSLARMCLWKREKTRDCFVPFSLRVSRHIEAAYDKSPNSIIVAVDSGVSYSINMKDMTYQTAKSSGRIKREDDVSGSDAGLPRDWLPMNGEAVIRHQLVSGSAEYDKVFNHFKKSGPSYSSISKIELVQNPVLYRQYQSKKKDVERNLKNSVPAECELFHGTSLDDAEKICADGFDRGFAGRNGTMLGKGTYFHVNSSYSVSYSSSSIGHREKCMFLASVLTGNYCKGNPSYVCPPPMGFGSSHLRKYDSVVDDPLSPSIFVVFKDASMYPKYLITFR